jgi:copper homeostasis protein
MSFQLEICCFNYASAFSASRAGANRIELCSDPAQGGTTPDYATIKLARKNLSIALYPIIRPRGGDFLFQEEEKEIMMEDVLVCKNLGCDGVVIGMLLPDGSVDKDGCSRLVERAYPMGVTFHRAFDHTPSPFDALEDIINVGCERILTSGQRPTAMEGALLIRDLIDRADNRIIIMPGSGVRADNILELAHLSRASEFHSSARMESRSNMNYSNPAMQENLSWVTTNPGEIEAMRAKLTHHFAFRADRAENT